MKGAHHVGLTAVRAGRDPGGAESRALGKRERMRLAELVTRPVPVRESAIGEELAHRAGRGGRRRQGLVEALGDLRQVEGEVDPGERREARQGDLLGRRPAPHLECDRHAEGGRARAQPEEPGERRAERRAERRGGRRRHSREHGLAPGEAAVGRPLEATGAGQGGHDAPHRLAVQSLENHPAGALPRPRELERSGEGDAGPGGGAAGVAIEGEGDRRREERAGAGLAVGVLAEVELQLGAPGGGGEPQVEGDHLQSPRSPQIPGVGGKSERLGRRGTGGDINGARGGHVAGRSQGDPSAFEVPLRPAGRPIGRLVGDIAGYHHPGVGGEADGKPRRPGAGEPVVSERQHRLAEALGKDARPEQVLDLELHPESRERARVEEERQHVEAVFDRRLLIEESLEDGSEIRRRLRPGQLAGMEPERRPAGEGEGEVGRDALHPYRRDLWRRGVAGGGQAETGDGETG